MPQEPRESLQRVDADSIDKFFPVNLSALSEEKQQELAGKLQEQNLKLREELGTRLVKSMNAENDMSMAMRQVALLDSEKKIYTVDKKFETGSGEIKVKIRGGDTKFIIPILVVIGCIILGIVLLVSGK
jgi:hypothetical protein